LYACSPRSLLSGLRLRCVLDEPGLVGGSEETGPTPAAAAQGADTPLTGLAFSDEFLRVAGQGVTIRDGHRPLAAAPADELGEVAAVVGIAAIGQPEYM